MPKNQTKLNCKQSNIKNRRFTKKKNSEKESPTKAEQEEDSENVNMEGSIALDKGKVNKRKRPVQDNNTTVKRQKVSEEEEGLDKPKKIKPLQNSDKEPQIVNNNTRKRSPSLKQRNQSEVKKLDLKVISQNDESPRKSERGKSKSQKEKPVLKNTRNPYIKILDQLPKEILSKIDSTKENINDICRTITLPDDYRPERVIRWIKKVSLNELRIIKDEIYKIRWKRCEIRKGEGVSFESSENKGISYHSQRSETSSKLGSDKCTAIKSRDTPNRTINYNITNAEDNSACSKTSSNTKPKTNVVRIPLGLEKKGSMSRPKVKKSPFVPAGKIAKFVSSVPGKSFIVHLKKSPETVENDNIEVTLRRNLFSSRNEQEIVVENLEKSKISFNPQPLKQYNNGYNKLKIDNDHLINVFSSVGGNNDHDSINFNWVGNCESQDLNGHDNYLKADPHESKFCNIPQSNISQMMDSVEGCGDFYFHKQILASRDEPLKSIVGNSFNMIPAFSMTEIQLI